jgi:hypothetical protein
VNVKLVTVRLPVTHSFDEERISPQSIQIGGPTPTQAVTRITFGSVTRPVKQVSQIFSELVISYSSYSAILDKAEGRKMVWQIIARKEKLQVHDWIKSTN